MHSHMGWRWCHPGALATSTPASQRFIIRLSAFTAASVLCAVAPNIETLLAARSIQGFAAGVLPPQVLGIIQQLFQSDERGRAFGLFGAMTAIATALGPALGGILFSVGDPVHGWRWLFWMNVPLGAMAVFFAITILPDDRMRNAVRRPLDLVGVALLGMRTFCLMLPFVLTIGSSADDELRWLWLMPFAGVATLFVWWENRCKLRGTAPAVDFALLRMGSFRDGLLVATAYAAALPAIFLLITLYLQDGLGQTAFIAGIVSVPFAAAATVTAWLSGPGPSSFPPCTAAPAATRTSHTTSDFRVA